MKNCFNPSALTLAVLGAFAATTQLVQAQTSPAQTTANELPAIVVTANRLPQLVSDTIANTTLLSRTDIERSGAVDLPGLLVNQAGIEFGRNGGVGQAASIFIRGTPAHQTLVLLDGVAINTQNDGAANLTLIPLNSIERIEIVRGNVSAAYGSNAVGGVIQIFTKQANGNTPLSADVNVGLGTQKQRSIGANIGLGNNDTRVLLAVSRTTTQGISATRIDQNPAENPDTDGSSQTTGSLGIKHRVSSALNLGLQVLNTAQSNQYDDHYVMGNNVVQHAKLNQVSGFADWRIAPTWLLQAKASENKQTALDDNDNVVNSTSSSRRQVASVQNTVDLGRLGTIFAGIEYDTVRFDSESFGAYPSKTSNVRRNNTALLQGWQGKVNGFAWNANVRQDRTGDDNVSTYAVGGSYDITPVVSVRASQATAFNRPSLNQLWGNSKLEAERAKTRELGVQWQQGANLVRLTAFNSQYTNQFGYDSVTYQTTNLARTSNQGVEVLAETALPWQGGKLRVGFTSHKPLNDVTDQLLDRRAKQQLHVGIAGALGAYTWDTNINYVGKRNDNYYPDYPALPEPVVLKAYVKLDATVGYAINAQTKLSLGLSNITHANDQSAYGYNGTPRGALIKLNYALK